MPAQQHGMSDEQFLAFVARGACDSCGATEPGTKHGWHIDHDHSCCPSEKSKCGKCVRGLLCGACNTSLGLMGENPERILMLAAYAFRVLEADSLKGDLGGS